MSSSLSRSRAWSHLRSPTNESRSRQSTPRSRSGWRRASRGGSRQCSAVLVARRLDRDHRARRRRNGRSSSGSGTGSTSRSSRSHSSGPSSTVLLVKEWFDRPRPDAGSAVDLPESYSFPSGHAAAGGASLGALAVLACGASADPIVRGYGSGRSRSSSGVAVGLSRIALNVHYVTDVLAGWCFGLAWLAACLLVRERFRDVRLRCPRGRARRQAARRAPAGDRGPARLGP